ncbi:MAG: glutathione synthase [Bdellovibrionales bacterium]|nr:glutathione synthase [Bdellovibrionales bacterium]
MKIGFIMDPLTTIRPQKDTSYILMCAALERAHQVFHILQEDISFHKDHVRLQGTEVHLPEDISSSLFKCEVKKTFSADEMDVLFVRKDPPFDRRYFYTTLLLDFVANSVRVVNPPQVLRDWNEKLCALHFLNWVPQTLISQNLNEITEFIKEFKTAILKPLDGFGGRGILKVGSDDSDLKTKILSITEAESKKIVVNEFIPEAVHGDKRILFVDGNPIGGILRKAKTSGALNNLDQGGVAHPYQLNSKDIQICNQLGEKFKELGLFFVGIDLLGDRLTEINITSPTGLQELMKFENKSFHHQVIQALE